MTPSRRAAWRPHRDVIWTAVISVGLGLGLGMTAAAALDRRSPRGEASAIALRDGYRPGDPLLAEWQIGYLRTCPGRITRWMTSRTDPRLLFRLPSYDLPVRSDSDPPLPGIITVPIAPVPIPPLPPGEADYHAVVDFKCNWLQRLVPALAIRVEYPLLTIKILPP